MWKHFKFNPKTIHLSYDADEQFNEFDILLRSEWDRAVSQGLFQFPIDYNAKQRLLDDGNLNYIIELNRDRQEKRRAPYPFEHLNTPFDNNKFHFNKIKDEEILFALDNEQQTNKHLVIINNAPIRPYHVLLVPYRELEQRQAVTTDSLIFGFELIASSAHPHLFVGFNSLCGYASINHLHFHALYIPGPIFVQTIECTPFHIKSNCYLLDAFETQAFGFESKTNDDFNRVAEYIYRIANYLLLNNIAHNLVIVKGKSFSSTENVLRCFIWFRKSVRSGKKFERCNFACLELAGFMTHHVDEVYYSLTESELCKHMNGLALSHNEQERIKTDVKCLLDD